MPDVRQGVHDALLGDAAKEPASHWEQLEEPAAAAVPVPQIVQAVAA